MKAHTDPERRAILKTAALAGTASLVNGVPLASYVIAPALIKGRDTWFDFGPVETPAAGSIKMLQYKFMAKDGWVVLPRKGIVWAKTEADGRLTIFSAACTHVNCTVNWREESKSFECPCHSGRFDANGQPIAGPPTKPLAILEHKVEGGLLLVRLPA
jgi:Rieske Fe-S protein